MILCFIIILSYCDKIYFACFSLHVVQSRWRKSILEPRKCPHCPGESSASHVLCWKASGNCQRGNCLHLFPQRESDNNNWPTPPPTGCVKDSTEKYRSLLIDAKAFLGQYNFFDAEPHLLYCPLTDRRQKWRSDSKDELVRSAAGCGPKVQCKYSHQYFAQYWYKQLSSDSKSPRLPQSFRWVYILQKCLIYCYLIQIICYSFNSFF